MPAKRRLTVTAVEKFKPPDRGRVEYPDTEVPGLVLRVTSKGGKSWSVYLFDVGTKRRFTIGRYPEFGPKEAREAARAARARMAQGHDPFEDRRIRKEERQKRKENTFKAITKEFILKHARGEAHFQGKAGAEPYLRTWARMEHLLEKYVEPKWGKRNIRDIRKRDVMNLLDEIKVHGGSQANYIFAVVRKLFNWAEEREIVETSPCHKVKRPHKPQPRNHPLTDTETKAFWKASEKLGYPVGDCYRVLLLTAQRLSEVSEMRWSELDLKEGVWVLPPERTKGKRRHEVPLSPDCVRILRSVPVVDNSDFVFTTNGGISPINGHSKAKKELNKKANIIDLHLHDLRETAATNMREHLSITSDVIGQVLNHAPAGVTQRHYASRSSMKDKRHALDVWAAHLKKLVSKE